jgi:hypothetical protein
MKKIAVFIASIVFVLSGFFLSPAPLAFAQTANTPGSLTVDTNIESALSSGCSNLFSSECALSLFYDIILQPSFWLVGVAANILDFFLGYSLDSNAYRAEFVQKGWALIRDISNVAFIFTLLYLAIKHILGSSSKKYIPTLIIVALLLNFSLFFTKVVIDAGNILARAFYNSIVIENDPNYEEGEAGYKSITLGIVDKINPQQLLSSTMIGLGGSVSGQYNSATNQFEGPVTPVISGRAGIFFTVFILIVIVNLVLTWTFLSVALLFVGRVIGLWFSMIFSPIAFITLAVPGSSGFVKQMSFDTWKDTVLKLAFMAPIFIFFLYLTISFLSIFVASQILPEGGDPFLNLMKIFIPFIFIIVLLQAAKKTADSMAGDFGSAVKSMVGKAMGAVAGGALGATAFVGRATIGRIADSQLRNGRFEQRIQEAESRGDRTTARLLTTQMNAMKKLNESSFDLRNAGKAKGVAGWASRQLGAGLGAGITSFSGDKFKAGDGSKESRKKYIDEIKKERLDLAQDLGSIADNEDSQIQLREERRQLANYQLERRRLINTGQNTNQVDINITNSQNNIAMIEGEHASITRDRRSGFANRVEDSMWESLISGGENAELHADEIRQGNRSRNAEQRALDALRALATPPAPPPGANPPAGGGPNNPNPGP